MIDSSRFKYGIEHEIALLGPDGFLDFTNLNQTLLNAVIDRLPRYESDYPGLRVGDIGIKDKRWYIEGLERFDEAGIFSHITPRGLELRTPISHSIDEAVTHLCDIRRLAETELRKLDIAIVETSFNPFQTTFEPDPPLNKLELQYGETTQFETAGIYMLTYGPDINLSHPDWGDGKLIDLARKLTFYSPYLVPFSFNAPFYAGERWNGYSVRTYYRTGARPAAVAYVNAVGAAQYDPLTVHAARTTSEHGRLEFKAFDTALTSEGYRALTALIKGLALDESLPGRSDRPDSELHQLSAHQAFDNQNIYKEARVVLEAADKALADDDDRHSLASLQALLEAKRTPAHAVIERYNKTQNVLLALETTYGRDGF